MAKKTMNYFQVTGEAADNGWIIKNQRLIESYFDDYMRLKGFVPVLDKDVKFSWSFNSDKQLFDYKVARKVVRANSKKWLGFISADQLMVSMDMTEVKVES